MISLCTSADEKRLLSFLDKEPYFNLLILADIKNYGFSSSFQKIYKSESQEKIDFVYLVFYGNLILSGDLEALDTEFIKLLMSENELKMLMGKDDLISACLPSLPAGVLYKQNNFYALKKEGKLLSDFADIEKAELKDAADIHAFLMKIPSFKNTYPDISMIENRIKSGEGTHVFIKKDGEIIAQGNTSASSDSAIMIGGVAVLPEYRGQGTGKRISSFLTRLALNQGFSPCLFNEKAEEESLYFDIGYKKIGIWSTIENLGGKND